MSDQPRRPDDHADGPFTSLDGSEEPRSIPRHPEEEPITAPIPEVTDPADGSEDRGEQEHDDARSKAQPEDAAADRDRSEDAITAESGYEDGGQPGEQPAGDPGQDPVQKAGTEAFPITGLMPAVDHTQLPLPIEPFPTDSFEPLDPGYEYVDGRPARHAPRDSVDDLNDDLFAGAAVVPSKAEYREQQRAARAEQRDQAEWERIQQLADDEREYRASGRRPMPRGAKLAVAGAAVLLGLGLGTAGVMYVLNDDDAAPPAPAEQSTSATPSPTRSTATPTPEPTPTQRTPEVYEPAPVVPGEVSQAPEPTFEPEPEPEPSTTPETAEPTTEAPEPTQEPPAQPTQAPTQPAPTQPGPTQPAPTQPIQPSAPPGEGQPTDAPEDAAAGAGAGADEDAAAQPPAEEARG